MSEPKHTPGPWSWHGIELLSEDEFVLATNIRSKPSNPNARLISAAPDMLAMLKMLMNRADQDMISSAIFPHKELRSLIAKAEGKE